MNLNNIPIFIFEDLLCFSECDIVEVMKEVDNVTLLIACQGADLNIIWKITSSFSATARGYFYDDINQFNDSTPEQVQDARSKIQSIMDDLYYDGTLQIDSIKMSA